MAAGADAPLGPLLWVDAQYRRDESLPTCFGDSYLVALNPLFGGVRRHVLDLGVRFVDDDDHPIVRRYRVAPLTALAPVLEAGIVPYTGDVDVLEDIVAAAGDSPVDANEIRMFFDPHTALHESAHLIADRTLRGRLDTAPELDHLAPVLAALLAEATANAVEALGVLHADHPTHELLWSWNSLGTIRAPRRGALEAVAHADGMAAAFATALWVFFHQNARADTNALGHRYLAACARSAFADTDATAEWRRLAVNTFASVLALDEGARAVTTPAYFDLVGRREHFDEVTRLDLDDDDVIAGTGIAEAVSALTDAARGWLVAPGDLDATGGDS